MDNKKDCLKLLVNMFELTLFLSILTKYKISENKLNVNKNKFVCNKIIEPEFNVPQKLLAE
jgi:hypothetical protein